MTLDAWTLSAVGIFLAVMIIAVFVSRSKLRQLNISRRASWIEDVEQLDP